MTFPGFPGFGAAPFFPSADPFFAQQSPFTPFPGAGFPPAGFPGVALPPSGAPFGARGFGAPAGAPNQPVGADGLVPHHEGETNVPTLTYFGTYGLAQAVRLVFVEAGAHFHEREIDSKEDWESLKPRLAWGQLPVLEIDGQVLTQSTAILRYLGRKYNLAGRTSAEQAEVDSVLEAVKDVGSAFPMRPIFGAIASGGDPIAAAAEHVEDLRKHLVKFENYLQAKVERENIPESAELFFVGNSLTIADLQVYASLHLVATFAGEHGAFENLPLLQRALDSTFHRPNIQTFLEGERSFPVVPSPEKLQEVFKILS